MPPIRTRRNAFSCSLSLRNPFINTLRIDRFPPFSSYRPSRGLIINRNCKIFSRPQHDRITVLQIPVEGTLVLGQEAGTLKEGMPL